MLHALFQQRRARPLHQREGQEQRPGDGQRRNFPGNARRDQPDTPPGAGIAEIVGVAGIAPQPAVHHLSLVGRVGLELRQLPVSDPFEENTDQIECDARPGDAGDRGGFRAAEDAELRGRGDEEQQHGLPEPDLRQRGDGEAAFLAVLAQHAFIAFVLAFRAPAAQQVDAEPEAPGGRHRQQQVCKGTRLGKLHPAGKRHQGHACAPEGIDEGHIVDLDGNHPQDEHHAHQYRGIGKQSIDHAVAFPSSISRCA